jgi:hypothetical protein
MVMRDPLFSRMPLITCTRVHARLISHTSLLSSRIEGQGGSPLSAWAYCPASHSKGHQIAQKKLTMRRRGKHLPGRHEHKVKKVLKKTKMKPTSPPRPITPPMRPAGSSRRVTASPLPCPFVSEPVRTPHRPRARESATPDNGRSAISKARAGVTLRLVARIFASLAAVTGHAHPYAHSNRF